MVIVNKIKENIYQIRVVDKESKNFHGCLFPVIDGTSYASYLVLDDQVTLIDTIETKYFPQFEKALDEILVGRKIDNLIINHVEPDHSQSFALTKEKYPETKVYTSKSGIKGMQEQFFKDYEYISVQTDDSINTGKYNFIFKETPLVHWPDNMWTYLPEEQILFSNDAFGQLIVDDVVYDSEISVDKLLAYSKEYYANIVWPNNMQVKNLLTKLAANPLDIKLIAPSHGIMIKEYINEIMNQYQEFTEAKTTNKALVIYDSIWGNTENMAYTLVDELKEIGFETKIFSLSNDRISEIMSELLDTQLLVLGSSNHNNCILPTVADFLERLKASRFKERDAIVFGSYGWANIPFKDLATRVEACGFKLLAEPIIINYTPNNQENQNIKNLLADALNK